MGYSLLHRLFVRGLASFVLSLLTVMYPLMCFSQSQDTTANQKIFNTVNEVSHSEILNEEPFAEEPIEGSDAETTISDSASEIVDQFSTSKNSQKSPVLSFASQSLTVTEGEGGLTIGVELLEGTSSTVEIKVVFISGSSSASASDISGYHSQTIRFDDRDPSGTIKSVRVQIADDDEYENTETAVFQLQDIRSGSIVEPSFLNLTIRDNDSPNIVINEIFTDPVEGYGDANGDGVTDPSEDQFVELLNKEDDTVDLSGWTLTSALQRRFTFPQGTTVPSGRSLVVFGGGMPKGFFGGSQVIVANGLGLDKTEGTVELRDDRGNVVSEVVYNLEGAGSQSVTRRDGSDSNTGLTYRHSEVNGSPNALYSPGKKADGTSFGSEFAVGIRGGEGWRLISTPTQNTTFKDLFGNFRTGTATGTNNSVSGATIFEWDPEGGGNFRPINDLSKEMEAGKGYAIYFYEDDEPNSPGLQGGFPKFITSDKPENNSVTLSVTSSDSDNSQTLSANEGWNLLGNPFGIEISVDEVFTSVNRALQIEDSDYNVNANLYVWEPSANGGNGDYIALEKDRGNTIAPFQAFWLRVNNVLDGDSFTVNVPFERSKLLANTDRRTYKESNNQDFSFELHLGDGKYYDDYQLVFNNEGSIDTDINDAYKLHPLNNGAISLYSLAGDNRLMKNVLPLDLGTSIEIPLHFKAGTRESLSFNWHDLDKMPDSWQIILTDKKLNKDINLRSVPDYSFTIPNEPNKGSIDNSGNTDLLNRSKNGSEDPRFILSISPGVNEQKNSPDIPESVKLNPNYPNPFNPTTTISFELKEDSEVLLSIWNIVGQKVVTLVDGMKEAGEHTATWNASEMPSGIYIAQLEVNGQVFIRKMTLIK